MTKQAVIWVGRDMDGSHYSFIIDKPVKGSNGLFNGNILHGNTLDIAGLAPGECCAFVRFAPRIATGDEDMEKHYVWHCGEWGEYDIEYGDIIVDALPDPAGYLPNAEDKVSALRAENARLRARLAELEK